MCILDCFSWPFGPSETICPKNHFRNTREIDVLEGFNSNEVAPQRCHNSQNTNSLLVETVLVLRQRLNSDQLRKINEKNLCMKQLWTTLADRRRAGPPAFRRKYSQLPNATLSFHLVGRLFLGNFGTFRSGEGPAPSV